MTIRERYRDHQANGHSPMMAAMLTVTFGQIMLVMAILGLFVGWLTS